MPVTEEVLGRYLLKPLKLGTLECLSGNVTVGFGKHSSRRGAEHTWPAIRGKSPRWKGQGLGGKLQSRAWVWEGPWPQRKLTPSKPQGPHLHSGPASCSANSQGEGALRLQEAVRYFAKVR